MSESFLIVGTQVTILFILIALGILAGKKKILTGEGVKSINDIMLYFVTPCVVINAFQRDFNPTMLKNLLLSILGALIAHAIGFVVGLIIIRDKDASRSIVLRFAICFSNCGFMALPLLDALLGSEGVFYGAGYIAVFNALIWTLGQYAMAKGNKGFDMKRLLFNPVLIAIILGLIFFFTSFRLPKLIAEPMEYLSALNTPVPMLIIGSTISGFKLKEMMSIKEELPALMGRHLIVPLILLGILYLMGYRGTLLVACICSASAPVAAMVTMFSIKFGKDEKLASKLVAVSSLFSIITMTFVISLARMVQ